MYMSNLMRSKLFVILSAEFNSIYMPLKITIPEFVMSTLFIVAVICEMANLQSTIYIQ